MLTVNHKNILSMRTIMDHNINDNSSSLIVEEYSGELKPHLLDVIFDPYGNVPSENFQKIVRELIEAVGFLRESGLHHGNLNWNSVLHKCFTVKLAYFKQKEDSVTLQQAQWSDWLGLLAMLEYVSKIASDANNNPSRRIYLGELEVLIRILKDSNMSNFCTIKDSLLDNAFFWDSDNRAELFVCTLPKFLKVKNEDFLKSIDDSEMCDLPWYGGDETNPLEVLVSHDVRDAQNQFRALVTLMNEHQDPSNPFDPRKIIDFLEFLSGSYTHAHELQLNVDSIFQAKFPKACVELKRITNMH